MPKLGASISHFTKVYIFPIMIVIFTIVAKIFLANFPFDHVCDTGEPLDQDYVNTTWTLKGNDFAYADTNIVLTEGITNHMFCGDMEWATIDQSRLSLIYDYTLSINGGLVGLCLLVAAGLLLKKYYVANYEVSTLYM